jgi:succinate dehydrogenase / fumarate reductase membrane anchor subunit
MSLRSPIGRVLGLGAAKEGASHWWSQRVTSVALLLLTIWFVVALLRLPDFAHATLVAWIAAPVNTVLLLLLTVTGIYHSQLGVQVVIEDYVMHHGLKVASLLLIDFIHVALGVLGVYSILRIGFGAAA